MPVIDKPLPSQEYLNECFDYNPETGSLKWKARPRHHFDNDRSHWISVSNAGAEAGNIHYGPMGPDGRDLSINRTRYRSHRIIWIMVYGSIPEGMWIDHANNNPLDNRLSNLRAATPADNCRNARRSKNNKSGFKGVHYRQDRGAWTARFTLDGKYISLGHFSTRGEAAVAYAKACLRYHGNFANIGFRVKSFTHGTHAR